ncbi:hypothetical protein FB565_007700 [Actinoplanes lutulentus]|uniref:Uncharacterized protein n=1 Tax=Actinoplanes lutulentus TaxID=1287878 RepID=A0A327ZFS1_9ACTN|nr:hypothetical protein [Actinoplanes lutulentus]RAK40190.1 hypothetical protein B0I29_103220 [Actinoplanes lutulentus]
MRRPPTATPVNLERFPPRGGAESLKIHGGCHHGHLGYQPQHYCHSSRPPRHSRAVPEPPLSCSCATCRPGPSPHPPASCGRISTRAVGAYAEVPYAPTAPAQSPRASRSGERAGVTGPRVRPNPRGTRRHARPERSHTQRHRPGRSGHTQHHCAISSLPGPRQETTQALGGASSSLPTPLCVPSTRPASRPPTCLSTHLLARPTDPQTCRPACTCRRAGPADRSTYLPLPTSWPGRPTYLPCRPVRPLRK